MLKIVVGLAVFFSLLYGLSYFFAYDTFGAITSLKVAGIITGAFVGAMILLPVVIRFTVPKF